MSNNQNPIVLPDAEHTPAPIVLPDAEHTPANEFKFNLSIYAKTFKNREKIKYPNIQKSKEPLKLMVVMLFLIVMIASLITTGEMSAPVLEVMHDIIILI